MDYHKINEEFNCDGVVLTAKKARTRFMTPEIAKEYNYIPQRLNCYGCYFGREKHSRCCGIVHIDYRCTIDNPMCKGEDRDDKTPIIYKKAN